MVGFNFAPRGWATCSGQILSIAQNTAVFSLIGTIYGGNGTTNFGLPDFRGRVPVHFGQGPGLSLYDEGEIGGEESHTLTLTEIPAHNHGGAPLSNVATGTSSSPTGSVPAKPGSVNVRFATMYSSAASDTASAVAIAPSGSGGAHSNLMPYLSILFIIALQGVFPSRP